MADMHLCLEPVQLQKYRNYVCSALRSQCTWHVGRLLVHKTVIINSRFCENGIGCMCTDSKIGL